MLVVHNFMPHEHRGPVLDEGAIDNFDRTHHAGTKAPGLSKNHLHREDPQLFATSFMYGMADGDVT
ncbi:hypothetical protein D3C72_2178960 [compost metagenome]